MECVAHFDRRLTVDLFNSADWNDFETIVPTIFELNLSKGLLWSVTPLNALFFVELWRNFYPPQLHQLLCNDY
jgi:hypothetical protein